jgi:hypothetical protein
MRQDNATSSCHVDDTVSIVPNIGVVGTREVLRRHDGICKGWAIIHRDITFRTIREREHKSATYLRHHSWRSSISARDGKRFLNVNGVLQKNDVVSCADVCTWVILCLMLFVGIRQWQGTIWLLDPVYRRDDTVR